jgi:cell division protein FtsW (lipid II flippase)
MLYGAAVLAFFILTPKVLPSRSEAPKWFIDLLVTLVFGLATTTICIIIFESSLGNNIIMALIVIGATGWYTFSQKNIWLYSVLLCGGLCVLECLCFRIRADIGTHFILTTCAVAGATVLILNKYKQWKQ